MKIEEDIFKKLVDELMKRVKSGNKNKNP